jgi:hypothetical protein
MEKSKTTQDITRQDVLTAAENYLKARQKTHEGETIGTFLYCLYKEKHVNECIEQTSIQISEALAAFNSQYVHKTLADEMGGYWLDSFCDFLARLNKVLLYMASCKTAMVSTEVCFLNGSDIPNNYSQEALQRLKREYEIKLQRFKDGEDFE